MPKNITTGIVTPKGLIEFRFEPFYFKNACILAVYCTYGGALHCFHMVEEVPGSYSILDKNNCPYDFHDLEQLLSDAISTILTKQ